MNEEARICFINSQIILANIEMQMMIAANQERERNGLSLAYGEEQWANFLKEKETILGYNEVISYLRG